MRLLLVVSLACTTLNAVDVAAQAPRLGSARAVDSAPTMLLAELLKAEQIFMGTITAIKRVETATGSTVEEIRFARVTSLRGASLPEKLTQRYPKDTGYSLQAGDVVLWFTDPDPTAPDTLRTTRGGGAGRFLLRAGYALNERSNAGLLGSNGSSGPIATEFLLKQIRESRP